MVCVDLSPADRCQHREEEAAKDRQSGSSCHGHCKCPFTEHLTQDCSQQVGVSPRPRGHSQPSSLSSFYLSVSQPRAQIFAWSAVTSSAFLSTRLRPVKDPHEEEREGPDQTHSSPEDPCLLI